MNRIFKKTFLKIILSAIAILILSGCSAHSQIGPGRLKPIQVFQPNSGSNYLFISKNTQE